MTFKTLTAAIMTAFLALGAATAPAMAHSHHHNFFKAAATGAVAGVAVSAITGHL